MAFSATAVSAPIVPARAQVDEPAHATEGEPPVQMLRVEYGAPAGCSSRAAFVAELEARTRRVRVVDTTEPIASIAVELGDRTTGIVGQLRLREPDGTETLRAVAGKSCEEVVSALALIAAVLVDPDAATHAAPPPTAPATPAPPAPAGSAPVPAPRAEEPAWRLLPSFGAGLSVTSTVAPDPSFAPSLELGLHAERGAHHGPFLLLSFERFASSSVSTDAGVADFSTWLGRLSLCPLRWPPTSSLSVAPCAAFEAGSLHVDVANTLDKQEPTVPWFAAGPGLHVEARPLRVLALELDLLGIFPLVRDSFYFSPNLPVFSVPVFGWTGRVGVKAVWP